LFSHSLVLAFQVEQNNGEEDAHLHVPVARREDTGKYAVTVSNPFGENTGFINVIVLGECREFPILFNMSLYGRFNSS